MDFIAYCLAPRGKKERVQYVTSTFASYTGIQDELKLLKGKKYNGIDFRISFSPEDRKLTEAEFKSFAEEVVKGYLGDRNYIAVMHGDTEHQHIHIISTFLDANGKALNFAGRRNANAEAVRRQEIVDTACKKFNLSVLPRQDNSYNARDGIPGYEYKKERITKAEKSMKDRGQDLWLDDMRNAVSDSLSACRDFDSFVSALAKQGITISRETASTLTFQNANGMKARLNRLFSNMKTRQDIERKLAKNKSKEDRMNAKMEELLKAERSFTSRIYDFADRLLKSGKSEQEVRNRIDMILRHKTESEDISERWDALRKMKESLAQEKEKWYDERKTEYEQQQKIRALQRILQSGNPIVALAAALIFVIAELKQQQQKQQQQHEKEKQHVHDILNPASMLKTPDPDRRPGFGQGR
jgi:hypothetical protein